MTTKTWSGSSADWYADSGGEWSPPGDPGSGDDVVINSGEAELLSGDAAISVAQITMTAGILALQDPGKTQSVSGSVSLSGSATMELDGPYIGGSGGTSLTIDGNLTNSSTNGYGVWVGNSGITSADTLTVNGTGGLTNGSTSYITVEGSSTNVAQATLNVANAAAPGTENGTIVVEYDALHPRGLRIRSSALQKRSSKVQSQG